jgi:hypothetical protein
MKLRTSQSIIIGGSLFIPFVHFLPLNWDPDFGAQNQCVSSSVVDLDPDPHGSAKIWMAWIRNRIENAYPDPDAWKMTTINILWRTHRDYDLVLPFKKAFAPS